jgi:cyclopropane fatty-acyl-phospholipid synthase-like methyltransferase
MESEIPVDKQAVAHYYDNNTRRFLRFGKNKGTQNIHQQLWLPEVSSEVEASNYANLLVLRELEQIVTHNDLVIDLGCGVGGSLKYLSSHAGESVRFQGFTISQLQAELGQKAVETAGLHERIEIAQGDFMALPSGPPAKLAYAIEAFVHATHAEFFFQSVAARLQTGARLILIDDFRNREIPQSSEEATAIQHFQQGWHAHSLLTVEQVKKLASRHQLALRSQKDLTAYLPIGRPRDQLIGMMIKGFGKFMRKSTYLQSLTGGYAKQKCLRNKWVSYQMLVFEKGS